MNKKKHTIKDIAELAGVSIGTVDRVLHGRGRVSKKANKKINEIVKQIDYTPNPIARNLKNNKTFRICVVLPNPNKDAYWIPAQIGIEEAAREYRAFGIFVEKYIYNPHDKASFIKESKEALFSLPDAMLIATAHQKECIEIVEECKQRKIPIAFFNNHIEDIKNEIFIGQDLYQSGRIAALMVEKLVGLKSKIAIIHLDMEPHMRLKEEGFKDYFEERKGDSTILSKNFKTDDRTRLKIKTIHFFENHPDISAVFITNSKSHVLIDALEENLKDIAVIGYDLLQQNIAYLNEGKIDFLIHQMPKRQAYMGVSYLANHLLFSKPICVQNLLPIDIVSSENVRYYID